MAIAFVSTANSGGGVAVTSQTITPSITSGNTVVLSVMIQTTTVSSVTSSPSQTWTRKRQVIPGGANPNFELWTAPLSSLAVTSITINYVASTDACAIADEYSGVVAFGTTAQNSGSAGTLTVSLTTQDANNWIAGGVTVDSNTITTTTGIERANVAPFGGAGSVNGAAGDNTAASPSSISLAWSMTGSLSNAAAVIELRSATGADTLAFDDAAVGPITIITSGNWVVS